MFTGIIENTAVITDITENGSNKTFRLSSPLSNEFKVDQSVSHSGVCLTVEEVQDGSHTVTAVHETLQKTNLGHWQAGDVVNLERSLQMNGRLDGHIVQGHVDTTGTCIHKKEVAGSWEMRFEYPSEFAGLVIEKGSICLNGISLTVFDITDKQFSVAIIPYTYHHTNISSIEQGSVVNIEFDIIGKYAQRLFRLGSNKPS
jgi:riboflavin synthase